LNGSGSYALIVGVQCVYKGYVFDRIVVFTFHRVGSLLYKFAMLLVKGINMVSSDLGGCSFNEIKINKM
jgi:hypothetical protein